MPLSGGQLAGVLALPILGRGIRARGQEQADGRVVPHQRSHQQGEAPLDGMVARVGSEFEQQGNSFVLAGESSGVEGRIAPGPGEVDGNSRLGEGREKIEIAPLRRDLPGGSTFEAEGCGVGSGFDEGAHQVGQSKAKGEEQRRRAIVGSRVGFRARSE